MGVPSAIRRATGRFGPPARCSSACGAQYGWYDSSTNVTVKVTVRRGFLKSVEFTVAGVEQMQCHRRRGGLRSSISLAAEVFRAPAPPTPPVASSLCTALLGPTARALESILHSGLSSIVASLHVRSLRTSAPCVVDFCRRDSAATRLLCARAAPWCTKLVPRWYHVKLVLATENRKQVGTTFSSGADLGLLYLVPTWLSKF